MKLGSLCNVLSGFAFKSNLFGTEGMPIVRIRDVVRGYSDTYYSGEYDDKFILADGDVLVGMDGDFNTEYWSGGRALLNQRVCKIEVDPTKMCKEFLYYLLPLRLKKIWDDTPFVTVKHLSVKKILDIDVPDWPLETQKQIAAVLEKADQLRKDCQQMEQELNSLAQSVFIDMFGDPVTNPKGWDKRELSEMLSVNHGYAFKSEYFTSEGDYVLLTPGNFKEEGGYWDRGEKQKYYSGDIPTGYILEKDALLLAMTEQAAGLLGSSILVPESNKYLHNQRLGLVKFKDDEQNTVFYSYLFNNKSVRLAIHSSSTGTKVKHTSPTKLESIKVGVPPSTLQNDFELIIKTIEQNILLNNKAAYDYEQSFNALMQKAFKGELNL
ncbi:restriction endonuclease subunit S [Shewanella sp. UCD-FRSSP16_17]|uniref:restriction endonuclease subunit S n=1 Tax=Shewanella sp. UCD-FRSSP16_17 TaxID=1853256 RepID=UPI001E3629D3|nr:restriction endonuclease subunit S [Shewanella sp. UCD-FRSSP16_17]